MKPRTITLRRGIILYHGTSSDDDFDIPSGPAWFSDTESVARWFAKRNEDGRPRVITYRLIRNLRLARIDGIVDFDKATGIEDAAREYADPTDLANAVCERHEGWIIPNNYPDGADIMICSPENYLVFVGCRCLNS